METLKQIVKTLIVKGCGPELQHRLRRTHAIYQIRHNRHFREPEMALIPRLVSNGDVVADVGANVGVYTNEFSLAVGPNGRVYSFEPVGETYDILRMLVQRASLTNVSPFKMAVGSKSAECEMVVPAMSGFTGYYWAHVAEPGESGRREVVKIVSLDEFYSAEVVTSLNFIKCDVEGLELEVISGATETIRAQRPAWLIEVSRKNSAEVFTFLQDFGYRAFVFKEKLVETKAYRDKEFSNYFFLHPDSASWTRALPLLSV